MLKKLKNRYFIIRHGESRANVRNIIISNPRDGIAGFGLSRKGKKQVEESVLRSKALDSEMIIYSSDFLRAQETAEIAKKLLGAKKINFHKALRERYFGAFDKTSVSNYKIIWEKDRVNASRTYRGVESVRNVLKRMLGVITALEKKYKNKKILLVSHGDALQILQTFFDKKSPRQHRTIPHLKTAEMRELKRSH